MTAPSLRFRQTRRLKRGTLSVGFSSIVAVCALALTLYGQGKSTLSGRVTDSSGAVAPGAKVSLVNTNTGESRLVVCGEDGTYLVSLLPVGAYRLDVEHPGFKKYTRSGLSVNVDENLRVDVVLEVGAITDLIDVTSDAPLVETRSANQSMLIDAERIKQLPLNGRNALQLQFLLPGVTAHGAEGGGENRGVSINGSRGTMNNYTLDGGNAVDGFTNTAAVVPSPDALEEFSVVEFALSAEYGRGSGGTVNAVTRSGTNGFHATLFEFLRNDKLNARNFFAPSREVLRQNQFGAVVGGPVIKDKTFFFFSYQGTTQRFAATTTIPSLPSDLERQGDFSQAAQKPIDPLTGQGFLNDRIPSARIDPASQKFIDLWLPKSPNGQRGPFFFNSPSKNDVHQYLIKIDHLLTPSNRLSGRYFTNTNKTIQLGGNNLPGFENRPADFVTRSFAVNDTHTFRSNLLNDARFTFSRVAEQGGPVESHSLGEIGVKITETQLNGQSWFVLLTPDFRAVGTRVANEQRDLYQFSDSVNYVKGRHLLKFGGEVRRGLTDLLNGSSSGGFFNFAAQFTRVAFGDFLLGLPTQFLQDAPGHQLGRLTEYDFFIQDDFKLSRRLTLNLGLRYEPRVPQYEHNDELGTFRPGQKSTRYSNAPVGLVFAGEASVPRGTFASDKNNLAPRAGFAWDISGDGSTSVRGGYGVFYDNMRWAKDEGQAFAEPFTRVVNINAPGSLVDPYGASGVANPFPHDQAAKNNPNFRFTLPVTQYFYEPNFRIGYIQQWMFSLERQIGANSLIRTGYVGSKGTKLWASREYNVPLFVPGQSTVANIDARRPFAPDFASVDISESNGTSSYHALQISFNKRYSQGFTFLTSYSWSKSIDLISRGRRSLGTPNPNNIQINRGRSDFDVQHVYVGSFVWDFPFFKAPGTVAHTVLGGWQLTGILNLRSGIPFSVAAGRATSLSGTGGERADVIGDPQLSNDRSKDEKLARFFNIDAFAIPTDGSWGNSGRNILDGPGLVNFDFAFGKTFNIKEAHSIEFRVEAFNAFNKANFGTPNASRTSPNFGRILSALPGRVIQFGLKYSF